NKIVPSLNGSRGFFFEPNSGSTSNAGHGSSSSTSWSGSAPLRSRLRFHRLSGRIVGRIVVGKLWLGLVVVGVVVEID
nr:hypothetical protein [Tanacetum cinerariifolium]